MARLVDADRRVHLLDDVVAYLAQHGLANVSLRPLAEALGVSVNALVHHFGTKDDLILAALRRSERVQQAVEDRWLERQPRMSQADLMRAWWRWITASPQNLAIVRLGIEAAALDATVTGLPRAARGDQIGLWRRQMEERLVREGMPPAVAVTVALPAFEPAVQPRPHAGPLDLHRFASNVVVAAAFEDVVAAASAKLVLAGVALDVVVAGAAEQAVFALVAEDGVVPGAALDGIVAGIGVKPVVAAAAFEPVVALAAVQGVGAGFSKELVVVVVAAVVPGAVVSTAVVVVTVLT